MPSSAVNASLSTNVLLQPPRVGWSVALPAIHTWTPSTHLVSNHRRRKASPSMINAAIKSDLELVSMDSVMPKPANLPHLSANKEDNLEMVLWNSTNRLCAGTGLGGTRSTSGSSFAIHTPLQPSTSCRKSSRSFLNSASGFQPMELR